MLEFYSKSPELVDTKEIKKEFYRLLFDNKNNMVIITLHKINPDKKIKDLVYLKNITLSETLNSSSAKTTDQSKPSTREY
jgi:hypothetical protein